MTAPASLAHTGIYLRAPPRSDRALDDARRKLADLIHRHTGYALWVYLSSEADGGTGVVVSIASQSSGPSTQVDPRLVVACLRLMPARARDAISKIRLFLGPRNEWSVDIRRGWGPHLDDATPPGLLLGDAAYQIWVEKALTRLPRLEGGRRSSSSA